MSRFFVEGSDTDEEEQEEEEFQYDNEKTDLFETQENSTDSSQIIIKSFKFPKTGEEETQLNHISNQIHKILASILHLIENSELSNSHNYESDFTELSRLFSDFKSTGTEPENLPSILIDGILSISQAINDLDIPNKIEISQTFDQTCLPIQSDIEQYKHNQKNSENHYDYKINNNNNSKNKEKIEWFVSSDDDEAEKIKNKIKSETKKGRIGPNGKIIYDDEVEEEVIDNSLAKRELEKYIASRNSGNITCTAKRLSELLQGTTDHRLSQLLHQEIILTISSLNTDQALSINDWAIAFTSIAEYYGDPNLLLPLFHRLNKDYWAKTIDTRYLFNPATAQLHEMMPQFITLLTIFIESISNFTFSSTNTQTVQNTLENTQGNTTEHNNEKDQPNQANTQIEQKDAMKTIDYNVDKNSPQIIELFIRSANILIEHIYGNEAESEKVFKIASAILQMNNTIQLLDSNNIKARAGLFLAYNLAITDHPIEAAEVFRAVPHILSDYRHSRLLSNRTRAQIGIAAFKLKYYKTAYEMLRHFMNPKQIGRNIGQEPNSIFPSWMLINTKTIIYLYYMSAILIGLPAIAINETNTQKLNIHPKMHKDLLKETIAHPEIPLEKATAVASYAKEGDWRKAYEVVKDDIDDDFQDSFINDLKQISLCSFLLIAKRYYTSISVEFLSHMFEIETADIERIITDMINHNSPITGIYVNFNGKFEQNNSFIVF